MKIISIDIEATGTDTVKDRIVSLSMVIYQNLTEPLLPGFIPFDGCDVYFNPGFKMTQEVIDIHGITNERVAAEPPFSTHAANIMAMVQDAEILVGFNLYRFDLPILWEELNRCGYQWDWRKHHIIDAGNLFKKLEPRTIEAAVKFYLNMEHANAHSSWDDALVTAQVLAAQFQKYPDLHKLGPKELAEASQMDRNVDLAGKIVFNKDNVPVYAFGNAKGTPVVEDRSFGAWIMSRDFPTETKLALKRLLWPDQEALL